MAVCRSGRVAAVAAMAGIVVSALMTPALGADITAREVTERLFHADPAEPVDFSRLNLRELDMSGLDFKGAKLSGSDLFGADLTGADLSKTDLSKARLDRVVIIGVRFDGANLAGASLLRPSGYSTLTAQSNEAASFVGTDLRNAKIFGRFNRANLHGADLSGATLAPFGRTGFIEHIWRSELLGADLSEASAPRTICSKVPSLSRRCRPAACSSACSRLICNVPLVASACHSGNSSVPPQH